MLDFLLGLLPDFLKVYLGVKANEAESLGKAEQKVITLTEDVITLKAEAQADADAPTDKNSLIEALKNGKLALLLYMSVTLLCSCADNIVTVCPVTRQWTQKQQDEMAATLSTLPPDSPLIAMGIEWSRLRAEAKACSNTGG